MPALAADIRCFSLDKRLSIRVSTSSRAAGGATESQVIQGHVCRPSCSHRLAGRDGGTIFEVFEQHPLFDEPTLDATVWRYLDFTKFGAFLDTDAISFAKAEELGDPWEGSYTRANLAKQWDQATRDSDGAYHVETVLNMLADLRSLYVNCWRVNPGESAARWDLYLRNQHGVALSL